MYVIEVPFLDLDQIYRSEQPLRWIKLRDGKYVIQDGCLAVKVEQQKTRLIVSCTEDEFFDKWYNYFDLGTDYSKAYFNLRRQGEFLKVCAVRNAGTRIIKQDLFECIVTHLIYSNCDARVAKAVLNNFVVTCGVEHKQGMREAQRITWHEFPTPEAIIENVNKSILPPEAHKAVCEFCKDIIDGWLDLEELKNMDKYEALICLSDFISNERVLDFIYLYGIHELGSFPMNKAITDIVVREFWDVEVFAEEILENVKGQEGIVYMYIICNELNPPKNMADEMKVGEHRWG